MAPSATARRPVRGRLSLGKPKAGPQPVGAAASAGGRQRPNKLLLGVLGLVAVVAVGRVAMPGMFGGGSPALPPLAPITGRHLLLHSPSTTLPGGATASTVVRTGRNPFTPPPGYGS